MKKFIFILFLLCGCANFKTHKCPPKKFYYPTRCIVNIKTDKDFADIKILEMVKDMCGITDEDKCYIINTLNDEQFLGWSLVCF